MLPVSTDSEQSTLEGVLREVVETLAPIDRTPCSLGERQAADWLAARMERVAGVDVALEHEPSWGTFPPTATGLGAVGMLAAALVLSGRRASGALLAAGGLAAIVDEAQNGPRILRRLVRRRRDTVNVLARVGSWHLGGPHGDRDESRRGGDVEGSRRDEDAWSPRDDDAWSPRGTVVVIAHHDAPQTGMLFDQTLQRRLYEVAPSVIERVKTPLPQWWIGLAGPLCTIAGAASRRRGPALAALAIGALGTAIVADVWRNPTVQGANDNLSGVAALVALAELLAQRPVPGLRVLLVSCGAEETLQDGIRAFLASHRHELDPERTWFVNLDTVGSPHLVMLEAEGPVWMEEYAGPWLRDLLADCAQRLEIPLHRGYRARASTDSVIPSRAGYPTATLVSMTDWRSPANYHLPSDIPANLDYGTVAETTRLVYDLMGSLAER
jgi:hypothetical protein